MDLALETRAAAFRRAFTRFRRDVYLTFCTREGLLGDVDYMSLFIPTLPFTKHANKAPHFYALDAKLPLLLTVLLGLQHAAAMLGGLVAAPLGIAGACHLDNADTQYLLAVSLVGSGFLTLAQIARIRIPYTNFRIGTGMISVLGASFAPIPALSQAVPLMYKTGFCETGADGELLPCRKAYGALIATGALCALITILIGFLRPRFLNRILPTTVTGPVVLLIGLSLTQSAVQDWGGGGSCYNGGLCNTQVPSHAHPWGSGQFIGLGFSVVATIVLCEKFGPPIFKSCSVVIGLVIGCVIAAGTGYFDHKTIDAAPNGEFMWVRTFPMNLYGPLVLPLLAINIVTVMETMGDVTATADVSRVAIEGPEFDSRVQGGILASGLASIIACVATLPPLSTFAQNNSVVAMTQVASRRAGYACCVWLIIMGVVGKFSASVNAIPSAVIGGMTIFLFTSVAVAGLAIVSRSPFHRRDRIVMTVCLLFGFTATMSPNWFSRVFTYKGDNSSKQGFINAIIIFVETPYAIAGLAGVVAHLMFPEPKQDAIDAASVGASDYRSGISENADETVGVDPGLAEAELGEPAEKAG